MYLKAGGTWVFWQCILTSNVVQNGHWVGKLFPRSLAGSHLQGSTGQTKKRRIWEQLTE